MNNRERFNATMHYQPRDRAPLCDFGFWSETLVTWREQGLPDSINRSNADEFFGMDFGLDRLVNMSILSKGIEHPPPGRTYSFEYFKDATRISVGLVPSFEEKILEDRNDHELVQQPDGVRVLRRKFMSSIPLPQGHLLVDRSSWEKQYKPRLDPAHPDRFPVDWQQRLKIWTDPDREQVIGLPGGSLYGWLRNWLGLEQLSLVLYDDPAWFEEMVTTVADCIVGTLSRVLETGGQFDACFMWEDMCYNRGPLLSPEHFKRYLLPHYRRITDLLHKYGVDVICVDSDGQVDRLIPLWLEGGVNCILPIEVGTWGADPIRYRQEYGRDLLMMGGFDKRILARSKQEIEQEVYRLAPLVAEGGYIGFCDHRVPPDVPLENYRFYLETVRRVWGQGVDLKPLGRLG